MIPKVFATYCAILVLLMAFANYQGYVFTSLFNGEDQAAKAANRYHK